MRFFWPCLGLCLIASLWLGNAGAQPAEEFYLGKRELTLITSSAAGGGYDQYSRLLARHMARYRDVRAASETAPRHPDQGDPRLQGPTRGVPGGREGRDRRPVHERMVGAGTRLCTRSHRPRRAAATRTDGSAARPDAHRDAH